MCINQKLLRMCCILALASGASSVQAAVQVDISGDSGSNLVFGNVRVGTTSAVHNLSAKLTGGGANPSVSVLWPAGTNGFGPITTASTTLTQNGNPGIKTRGYSFTPATTGLFTQNATVITAAGNKPVTFSGTGVAPEFNSIEVAPFGLIDLGTSPLNAGDFEALTLLNSTTSGNLGVLNDLTVVSYSITGADASDFSLSGFVPNTVLSNFANNPLDVLSLLVNLSNTATPGFKTATLTFNTDQNAALGGDGDDFWFTLNANVLEPVVISAVPEPASFMIWGGLGAAGLIGRYRANRKKLA